MRKFVILPLAALLLLLCGCSETTVTWETVEDTIEASAILDEPAYTMTFEVPEDAVRQTFACDDSREVYDQADGDYEIVSEILTGSIDSAVKTLTGYDSRQLLMLHTTRFGMPEYQFAWYSLGETGGRLCRAAVLVDGQDCYCLSFCTDEDCTATYDSTMEHVFATLGLYHDEGF